MITKDAIKDDCGITNEIQSLKNLDHPNIIQLYEIYESDEYIFLVQEYIYLPYLSEFVKVGTL